MQLWRRLRRDWWAGQTLLAFSENLKHSHNLRSSLKLKSRREKTVFINNYLCSLSLRRENLNFKIFWFLKVEIFLNLLWKELIFSFIFYNISIILFLKRESLLWPVRSTVPLLQYLTPLSVFLKNSKTFLYNCKLIFISLYNIFINISFPILNPLFLSFINIIVNYFS